MGMYLITVNIRIIKKARLRGPVAQEDGADYQCLTEMRLACATPCFGMVTFKTPCSE